MNGYPHDLLRQAMIDQACAWQARYLSGEMTAAEKVEFLKWLQDSPRNVNEYLQASSMARLLPQALEGLAPAAPETTAAGNVVPLSAMSASSVTPSHGARKLAVSARFKMAASIAAAAVVLVGARWAWNTHAEPTYVVPHGDQRTVQLSDGSLMQLNSRSSARIRYSDRERLIELDSGQAMFDVARDPSRPFRVQAGPMEVVAIGTRFDVYRRSDRQVTVTVIEGRVEVVDRNAAGSKIKTGARSTPARPMQLSVGQQARAGSAEPSVAKVDLTAATAWVRREIVFNGQPLAEIAEEFNRYLSVPVHIEDPTLRATRVSGMFSAYDEAAFLAFLREFDGVRVEVGKKEIRVSR